jgi:hypothetical protein
MNATVPPPPPPPPGSFGLGRLPAAGEVLGEVVRLLTGHAGRVWTWTGHDGQTRRQRADMAEFIILAVAGVAANVGGVEQLLAGRPGSWEAGLVRDMLTATVGHDEAFLLQHRTVPLVVRVNVDDILNDLGIWQLYDEAREELERRYQAIGIPSVTGRPGSAEFEAAAAALQPGTDEQQTAADHLAELHARLDAQQHAEWAAYAHAFTAQVHQAAAALFPYLPVPVQVILELERRPDTGGAEELDGDGPVWRIWETARRATPLPGSGLPPASYPPGTDIPQVERDAGRTPLARLDDAHEGQS